MTLEKKFWEYHRSNPHVFELFKKYAQEIRDSGFRHYGSKSIFERVRWHLDVETLDPEGFKMNNNYSSRYARLLMFEDPTFEGFFRNRTLKTYSVLDDDWI